MTCRKDSKHTKGDEGVCEASSLRDFVADSFCALKFLLALTSLSGVKR
jgi:hypothetical protein